MVTQYIDIFPNIDFSFATVWKSFTQPTNKPSMPKINVSEWDESSIQQTTKKHEFSANNYSNIASSNTVRKFRLTIDKNRTTFRRLRMSPNRERQKPSGVTQKPGKFPLKPIKAQWIPNRAYHSVSPNFSSASCRYTVMTLIWELLIVTTLFSALSGFFSW